MWKEIKFSGQPNRNSIVVSQKVKLKILYNPVVPNLFGTRDWFRGRQFFHTCSPAISGGRAQAVM